MWATKKVKILRKGFDYVGSALRHETPQNWAFDALGIGGNEFVYKSACSAQHCGCTPGVVSDGELFEHVRGVARNLETFVLGGVLFLLVILLWAFLR